MKTTIELIKNFCIAWANTMVDDECKLPSEEGKRRYTETEGRYIANGLDTPCTCVETCPNPCKGECGCLACREAYCDFLDYE